jgi:glycosyltransferase involved in cell wall biosynthesis
MKIAIVHDHLIQRGGAEGVLEVFQNIFPEAPIFSLVYDSERMNGGFKEEKVKTSFIQNLPGGVSFFKWFLPLMPLATEKYNLNNYDIVISNSSAFAKGVITKPETLHICYCHTPTRYLWTDSHLYIKELPHNGVVKGVVSLFLPRLRIWDRMAADRVHKFIANSKTVQKRIEKYYNKDSKIIHPPIDVSKFKIFPNQENYFLAGGRLVAYKRFDLIVQAFNRLGIPLKIFGEGPELEKLQKIAKKNIEFLGNVSDEKRAELYGKCQAFIHPQEEDFGLMVVEAMASGRPVIAYNKGGALETVIEGRTGEFFDVQGWEALAHKVIKFKPEKYNPNEIREHAKKFDVVEFENKIKNLVEESWREFQIASND